LSKYPSYGCKGPFPERTRNWVRFAWMFVIFLTFLCPLPGVSAGPLNAPAEKQALEAAFLYRFLFFVDWPADKLGTETAPLIIGVLGDGLFDILLAETQHLKVNERPVVARHIQSPEQARDCHLLFIGKSMENDLQNILFKISGSSILTVSNIERFAENGGMIEFKIVNERLRFSINRETVDQQGLKLSSKLLKVALS
jgi:hypothetical protein